MARIAIIVHQSDVLDPSQYILRDVAQAWQEWGHTVHVLRGTGPHPADAMRADVALLHVDLTVVPGAYVALARQFPRTLNLGTWDISKRTISRHLVNPGDGYTGRVIVKTNSNCGGLKEAQARVRRPFSRCVHAVRRRLPWWTRDTLAAKDYRVFDAPSHVPWGVWRNRGLVVERFLPERHDGHYWLRSWLFMGEGETLSLRHGPRPIVAVPFVDGRTFIPPDIPPALRELRRALGFDYGKFDYAMVDGRPVLYDANRTPTNRTLDDAERTWQASELARGILPMLGVSPRSPVPHPTLDLSITPRITAPTSPS